MFNLEQAIKSWRLQASKTGLRAPEILDELESHLRDEIETTVAKGASEQVAFEAAVNRIGSTKSLKTEFAKIEPAHNWPVTFAFLLWICSVCVLVGSLSARLTSGKMTPLLFTHVVSLTAGYGAVLATGLLGIYFVCRRTSKAFSASHEEKFQRSVVRFNKVAAALVFFGAVSGMIWSKHQTGTYFEPTLRCSGPLCVATWLLGLCIYQRFSRPTAQTAMLLAIAGNIVISIAWFGIFVVYSAKGSLLLAILIAVHVTFIAIDLKREPSRVTV